MLLAVPRMGSSCSDGISIDGPTRVFSGIEVEHEGLYPTRAGIEYGFNQQKDRHMRLRMEARDSKAAGSELLPHRVLDPMKADKSTLEYSPLAIAHHSMNRLWRSNMATLRSSYSAVIC
jgi:hypothetical protein